MATDIDLAMADFLSDPGSGSVLSLLRAARSGSAVSARAGDSGKASRYEELLSDCRGLYHSVLVVESDPEIVGRNTLARVLAGISPFIQALNGTRTLMVKSPWEALMEAGAVVSEVASASQYLESAKLSTEQHYREDLLRIEDRLFHMDRKRGETPDAVENVHTVMDTLIATDIPSGSKPLVPFLMWTIIVLIDYMDLVSE